MNRVQALNTLGSAVVSEPGSPCLPLLSNGRYHVMLTGQGGGFSRWKGMGLTRWREDATCDAYGAFCYISDADSGYVWSTTRQPTLLRSGALPVGFACGLATFHSRVHGVEAQTEIAVSAVDAVELRRVRVTNYSSARLALALTGHAELVLAPAAADPAHTAFEKLFGETEILCDLQTIVCTRRASAPEDLTPSRFHLVGTEQSPADPLSYETDRTRFIGRGRGTADPQALDDALPLSGIAGPVLYPVGAIRCGVRLEPGESTTVDLLSGVSDTRQGCDELIRKYRDRRVADLLIDAATAHAQAVLDQLQASAEDTRCDADLAGALLIPDPALRAKPAVLARNTQGQAGLWRYTISGDLRIVLLLAGDPDNLDLACQLIRAHAYLRLSGIAVDAVVLADGADRGPELQRSLIALVDVDRVHKPGGIFVRSVEQIPENDRVLFQAVARVVLDDRDGPLTQQLERHRASRPITPSRVAWVDAEEIACQPGAAAEVPDRELIFRNGLGGFSADGREYVVTLTPERSAPMPWVNVLANPGFGSLVSERGSAATWSENAQAFRLAPWSNDPVSDPNTEAFYVRDEISGRYGSATLLPSAGATPYVTRHGFGYSVFERCEHGIETELTLFVAIDAPVKFAMLKLVNRLDQERSLSVSGYLEWVLGDERTKTGMHVSTTVDASSGTLHVANPYPTDVAGRTVFVDVDEAAGVDTSVCCDRREFIGHDGMPAPSRHDGGAAPEWHGWDCARPVRGDSRPVHAIGGQTRELVFLLGAGATPLVAHSLVTRGRGSTAAHGALAAVKRHWAETLRAVQVETPDRSLDLLVNGWLPYQVLASRLGARNAFDQSSGAFGFPDQLQDVMALVHAAPALVREHLLRSAARQFPRAMCSTGGIRHRGAACARAVPTTTCGCR